MSGTFGGREQRGIFPQPVGVVDPSRDFGYAGGALRQQSREVAGVLDRAGDTAARLYEQEAKSRGELEGANEDLARGPDGRVKPPDTDALKTGPFAGAGENARRAVLAQRYAHEVGLQGGDALVGLRGQHARDPDGFLQSARAWRDQQLQAMPAQIRPALAQQYGTVIGQHYRDLAGERMRFELEGAKGSSAAAFQKAGTEVFDRARAGDKEGTAAAQGAAIGLVDADQRAGLITPAEAEKRRRTIRVTMPAMAAGIAGANPAASGGAEAGSPLAYARQLATPESGGRDDAKNPRSSATGKHQFTEGTWLAVVRREMGRSLEGASEAEILKLRNDPAISERMAAAHIEKDIMPALQAAGVPVNGLTVYMGWHFGPGGGPRIAKAPDSAPMSNFLSEKELDANPHLKRMTVGAWKEKYGKHFPATAAPGDGAPEVLRSGDQSHPGWRPEWTALPLAEREEVAAYIDRVRTQARQEAAFARAEGAREAQRQVAEIDWKIADLQRQATENNRVLTGPEMVQQHTLLQQRQAVLAPFGGDPGQALRQATEFVERQGNRVAQDQAQVAQAVTDRETIQRLDPQGHAKFFGEIEDRQPEAQRAIIGARARELESQDREARAERERQEARAAQGRRETAADEISRTAQKANERRIRELDSQGADAFLNGAELAGMQPEAQAHAIDLRRQQLEGDLREREAAARTAEAQRRDLAQRQLREEGMAADRAVVQLLDPAHSREFLESIKDLEPEVQAALMDQRAKALQQGAKDLRTKTDKVAAYLRARDGTGTAAQVERDPENQRIALEDITEGGRVDPLDPEARRKVVAATAAGALPETIVRRGSDLLEGGSPEQLRSFAELHRAVMADDRAAREWTGVLGKNLMAAYTGLAERLEGLDPSNPEHARHIERLRGRAASVARGEGAVELAEARARLGVGTDAGKQNKALDALADGELSERGPTNETRPAAVPDALRQAMRTETLEGMAMGLGAKEAARLAWFSIERQGWGVSTFGNNQGSAYPELVRPEAGGGWNFGLRGGSFGGAVPAGPAPPRWVQHPPERFTAPFGKGGEIGVGWLRERLGDVVKAAGLPGAADMVPGRHILLRPDLSPGAPRDKKGNPTGYTVLVQRPGGYFDTLPGEGGRGDLRLNLAEEQAEHVERWRKPGGPGDQALARQARIAELEEAGRQAAFAARQTAVPVDPAALP